MLLKDYIDKHYGGNKAAFAKSVGTDRQRVHEWCEAGYIVFNGALYSKRRDIPDPN